MTGDYYKALLSAERLKKCYEIAPPRVRQYLVAEAKHLLLRIISGGSFLELGCGYGRILPGIAAKARWTVGIDNSLSSLELGGEFLRGVHNCTLIQMDAANLGFRDDSFDMTACIQNGISAFKVDRKQLIAEAIRVTKPGGRALFSSYSNKFWAHRLEWFRLQSEAGLIGEIDEDKTGGGVIICKDGFTAATISPEEFAALAAGFDVEFEVREVDESSVFCEIIVGNY